MNGPKILIRIVVVVTVLRVHPCLTPLRVAGVGSSWIWRKANRFWEKFPEKSVVVFYNLPHSATLLLLLPFKFLSLPLTFFSVLLIYSLIFFLLFIAFSCFLLSSFPGKIRRDEKGFISILAFMCTVLHESTYPTR